MSHRQQEAGFALVTALWACTILALVAASVVGMAQGERRITHNSIQLAVLKAADDGAIALAQLALLAPTKPGGFFLDGTALAIVCADHEVTVTLQDQAGLIDLNMAPGSLLRVLFEIVGRADAATAENLADRVLDWRERGAGRRLNGAKADDYRTAGLAYGPREARFATVSELDLVWGVSRELFDRVAPALTVSSQVSSVESSLAPRAVLQVLTHDDEDTIAAILRERTSSDGGQVLWPHGGTMVGRAVRITAETRGRDVMLARRSTVVRVTGFEHMPFWIYPDT